MRWKFSFIVPAFKNTVEPCEPFDYCSVAFLFLFGKVLEVLIKFELVKQLISQGFLSDMQYIFSLSSLMDEDLTFIPERIRHVLYQNSNAWTVVLDMSKESDSVWYNGVLYSLKVRDLSEKQNVLFKLRQLKFSATVNLLDLFPLMQMFTKALSLGLRCS